jgi:hypothetical protein
MTVVSNKVLQPERIDAARYNAQGFEMQLPPAEFSPTALLVSLPFVTQTTRPPDRLLGSCAESCEVLDLLTTVS